MYLMVSTRPDFATVFGMLSRFFNNRGKEHWEAPKRVFRCLKETKSKILVYRRVVPMLFKLEGFSNIEIGETIQIVTNK